MSPARKRLPAEERHARILRDIKVNPALRVVHLAKAFGVTTETIRRDLDALSADGRLSRTYGGAAAAPGREPAFHERQSRYVDERSRIGARAAELISPGDTLMIDSGSTTLHFVRHLVSFCDDLTVVTNSPAIAATAAANGTIRALLCPGEYDPREGGVFGAHAIEFLQRMRVNRAVIGASGLIEDGPTEALPAAASVKRTMLACADERTLLVDATKFGQKHIEIVCPLEGIHEVVTDRKPPAHLIAALREARVALFLPLKRQT
jgi:DeoR/GlpR family transcriptional regulator of sugar metabolism